jgi:hypothetical protein
MFLWNVGCFSKLYPRRQNSSWLRNLIKWVTVSLSSILVQGHLLPESRVRCDRTLRAVSLTCPWQPRGRCDRTLRAVSLTCPWQPRGRCDRTLRAVSLTCPWQPKGRCANSDVTMLPVGWAAHIAISEFPSRAWKPSSAARRDVTGGWGVPASGFLRRASLTKGSKDNRSHAELTGPLI